MIKYLDGSLRYNMTDTPDDYHKLELEARKKYWDSLDKLSKKNRFKLPKQRRDK